MGRKGRSGLRSLITNEEIKAIEYLLRRLEEIAVKEYTVTFVDPGKMGLFQEEQAAMSAVRAFLNRVRDE